MIGEAAILRKFETLDQERQTLLILRAFERARTQVTASIIRTSQDYAIEGYTAPLVWLDDLAQEGETNPVVLIEIVNQIPNDTLVLRERAASLATTLVNMVRAFVSTEDHAAITSLLGTALSTLANRLSALGRREDALRHAQEAVDIYRQLATERPDAFLPNLAGSLNNLARSLSDLGRREDALRHAQEAVETLSPYFLRSARCFWPVDGNDGTKLPTVCRGA